MNFVLAHLGQKVERRLLPRTFRSRSNQSCKMSSARSKNPSKVVKLRKLDTEVDKIRNIGIMAHIDAGKTTATERMLFYSGLIRHLGDIDDGDTVMDYMEQERNRGITIVSAAITFNWNKHKINLIDTPGHVDFTYEVERALRVLDGAVTIIDASAGVEAQTMTVWRQADSYNIPSIAFHNKMDKLRANFRKSVSSMREKLGANPLVIQLPVGQEKTFSGVVDLISMEKLTWDTGDMYGNTYNKVKLTGKSGGLYEEAVKHREVLLEQLAELDDSFAETVINSSSLLDIPSDDVHQALRKATLSKKGVPILCGSAFKNTAVQPLMNAVVQYLPGPSDIQHDFLQHYNDAFCALAFKIVHDQHRGVLTFVRIYSGVLRLGDPVYNANQRLAEKPMRILQIYADDHKEISTATAGNIVALSGLKLTRTGDTLVTIASVLSKGAASEVVKQQKFDPDLDEEGIDRLESTTEEDLMLAGVTPPDPVFFCSVEPPSLMEQKKLDVALANLEREDPSLRVRNDEETGQTILEGMGELHLDVIKDRILKEYGVDVYLGPLQIAYKETVTRPGEGSYTLDQTVGSRRHIVSMKVSVLPKPGSGLQKKIILDSTVQDVNLELTLKRYQQKAINRGMISALTKGPLLRSQLIDVEVRLHEFNATPRILEPMIAACTSVCVQQAFSEAEAVLMEPTMNMQIQTEEKYVGAVMSDLSNRRSDILEMRADGTFRTVLALSPLAELTGYSTVLRTMTSGLATFSMDLAEYRIVDRTQQDKIIEKMTNYRCMF